MIASGSPALPLFLAAWLGASPAPSSGSNLIENGDFERGKGVSPDGWQRPDELTTFWVESPGRKGRSIKIDTDVLASQYRERQDAIAKALAEGKEPPPPPARKPTRAPKFDTVAGLDGVHYASRKEVPIREGAAYRLSVDAKVEGKGNPRVWVKAIGEVKSSSGTRERVVWEKALECKGADKEWKTFSMAFSASGPVRQGATRLRVELYAYWPPAVYYFDNVRLEEIPAEGAQQTKTASEAPPGWYEGFELRRKITFPRKPSAGEAVLLRVRTSRATKPDARDLRVVLDHRQPLPLEVLEVGPGDTALIRFEVPEPSGEYWLYLGNPSAERPRRPQREPAGGLLLEVRELGEGDCGSWTEMRRLLESSREVAGYLAPRRIFLGIPPLGKTGNFVARYRGFLRIAQPGTYTFETASEGGSFVLVSGRLVASWPGFHGLAGYADEKAREKHSGKVRLAAGIHPIEYLVASKSGCIHVLAWKTEDEKTTRPIPESAFVQWLPAGLGPVEARKEFFPDFDWEIASDTNSDAERHDLAEIAFRFSGDLKGRGARRTRWDFGDGQVGEGPEVRHVYLRHGSYEVSVEVEVSAEAKVRATRTVVARFESFERSDLDSLLERYHQLTSAYDLEKLPPEHLARLVWLRSKDSAWKDALSQALDAWYRRRLPLGGPETDRVERLGFERARELLRRNELFRRGGEEGPAHQILETLASSATDAERREEAQALLAALDAKGESRDAGERKLRELHSGAKSARARRRAGIALAKILLATSREKEAREILERVESSDGSGAASRSREVSGGARSLSLDRLLEEKRFEEAAEEIERWEWELPLDLLTGGLAMARARLFLAQGKTPEALRELEAIERLEGARREAPRALLLAAEALEALGDRAKAEERLRRLERDYPHRPEAREARERLERLSSGPQPPERR